MKEGNRAKERAQKQTKTAGKKEANVWNALTLIMFRHSVSFTMLLTLIIHFLP
jgi:hypothetical protein